MKFIVNRVVACGFTNYGNPIIVGDYNIRLHGEDLAAMSAPVKPVGDVSLTGTSITKTKTIDGLTKPCGERIDRSEAFSGVIFCRPARTSEASGKYELANGSLQAEGVERDPRWSD